MRIDLNLEPGTRNDLLIVLTRSELEKAHLHIANRDGFMGEVGLRRDSDPTSELDFIRLKEHSTPLRSSVAAVRE